jgi:hypothetical protein
LWLFNNNKIKNATKTTELGIAFRSEIEARIYKTLVAEGFNPLYEKVTFTLSEKIRPTVPFFNRIKGLLGLDMKPVQAITYTPDFTFEYNGILIVIEVKGFENDVFPIKRNLFRKHLETLNQPSMFFEVRTKKELLEALRIIRMESPLVQRIRKLIPSLPEKDIPIGNKLLEARDWEELQNLVSSAIVKIERANSKGDDRYANIDLPSLYCLQAYIPDII